MAEYLRRLFFTGAVFEIKNLEKMRSSLRAVLKEARYVRDPQERRRNGAGMYTVPAYLGKRKDAGTLMKRFLNSDAADAEIDEKIARIASELRI